MLHADDQTPIHLGNNNGDWGTDLGYRAINPKRFVGDEVKLQFAVDKPPAAASVEIRTADVASSGSCFQYVEVNDFSYRLLDDGRDGVSTIDLPRGSIRSGSNTLRIHSKYCQDEKVVVNDFVVFRVVVRLEP